MNVIIPSLLDSRFSDVTFLPGSLSKKQAEQLFIFFKQHPLFNWKNANNGCEGRADAVCVLLDEWNIPNCKAWVFSGAYLKKHVGELIQNWKYHVSPVIAVEENGEIIHYVLDPSTAGALKSVDEWAIAATQLPHSYYFIRQSQWYIFPSKNIATEKWNPRNRQNRKWMIQCLAGINGLTANGKARLCFNKIQLKNTEAAFEKLKKEKPVLAFV
ncbi:MAG: protein-glutamine glutaminase family protein [Ferruginibacter sp.]